MCIRTLTKSDTNVCLAEQQVHPEQADDGVTVPGDRILKQERERRKRKGDVCSLSASEKEPILLPLLTDALLLRLHNYLCVMHKQQERVPPTHAQPPHNPLYPLHEIRVHIHV